MLPDNTATNIVGGFPRNVNHAVDLNSFYGYPPAINRSTGVRGQFVTDPSCLYDSATQRFFVVVLTLEAVPDYRRVHAREPPGPGGQPDVEPDRRLEHLPDRRHQRRDEYRRRQPGPYLGDYPHMGADANGIYLTTNAYPWGANGFGGAQIYALSKAQLAAGAASVTVVHLDTSGMVNVPRRWLDTAGLHRLAGSVSGQTVRYRQRRHRVFLSSNAAEEATHPVAGFGGRTSNQLIVWTLTNTSSLNSATPSLSLSNKVMHVGTYALPPKAKQPGSGTAPEHTVPQGDCLNDETTATIAGGGCYKLLVSTAVHNATKPRS